MQLFCSSVIQIRAHCHDCTAFHPDHNVIYPKIKFGTMVTFLPSVVVHGLLILHNNAETDVIVCLKPAKEDAHADPATVKRGRSNYLKLKPGLLQIYNKEPGHIQGGEPGPSNI